MFRRLFSLALVVVLASVLAQNKAAWVNLRIEGSTTTIFEGQVHTNGHNVTTVSGGNHHCDGTNGGANFFPGPTCISALDNASIIYDCFFDATFDVQFKFDDSFISSIGGENQTSTQFSGPPCTSALNKASVIRDFTFDGTYDVQLDDFFITSIGEDTETATQSWGILVNFQFIAVGGCQQEVKHMNDSILFAFDAFNAEHILKLTGPGIAQVGTPVVLTVTDGQTGEPVAGADVDGDSTSDDNGNVIVTFTERDFGLVEFKAEKSGSIRSNEIIVWVLPSS